MAQYRTGLCPAVGYKKADKHIHKVHKITLVITEKIAEAKVR